MSLDLAKCSLGIEFGSTRIKAVLVDENHAVVATGAHEWENRLENGIWTYSLDDIWSGLHDCYANLAADVQQRYGQEITTLGAIGFSAMMHGYMAFDDQGELLVPFRTWRNSNTHDASAKLTDYLQFNIPERWSIAHLYHCIINGEEHLSKLKFFTTLAGFIHWKLSDKKVLGIGDAAGMFPIDSTTYDYDQTLLEKFDTLSAQSGFKLKVKDLLPQVLLAGQDAGCLTEAGAKLLDPSGKLQPGVPMCPPEGDAGTGMVATNAVAVRTGNVSAGTSIFAMVVLEKALAKLHREIDMVTTPDGLPVAMVHANNCTSDLNAWVGLFAEFAKLAGANLDTNQLFGLLYKHALEGDKDCGGLTSYGYYSGEFITGLEEGRPLFVRTPHANFNLANFMRTHLYAALGAIKIGMDILVKEEHVKIDRLLGHGGLFKTEGVAQSLMASAINVPVSVMATAGEGGPWGQAVLASYMIHKQDGESLPEFLDKKVFKDSQGTTLEPIPADTAGYECFIERYKAGLAAEKAAVAAIKDE